MRKRNVPSSPDRERDAGVRPGPGVDGPAACGKGERFGALLVVLVVVGEIEVARGVGFGRLRNSTILFLSQLFSSQLQASGEKFAFFIDHPLG